jgi:hypothetical protein
MDSYEREELRVRFTDLRKRLKRNGHLDPPQTLIVRGERAIPYNRFRYSTDERAELQTAPQWSSLTKRLSAERSGACENCGGSRRLQAHHRYYFAGRRPWEYSLEDFLLLCGICHTLVHFDVDRAIETAARHAREDEERARLEVDEDMLEWEIDMARGFYDDPTLEYDEDNAGDWEAEHGLDMGDLAEEAALEDEMD